MKLLKYCQLGKQLGDLFEMNYSIQLKVISSC